MENTMLEDAQIADLAFESLVAGDNAQHERCQLALDGDDAARYECLLAVQAAKAMRDGAQCA
jgi:hypothetical protein